MDDLDMSGVDPLRWEEVRRRVAIVKAYLALPAPTDEDRKSHAARLDRSVNQFMALVRSWREHGSAARLAASGAHRGEARAPGRRAIDRSAKDEAARVIAALGPNAPLADIVLAVGETCAALGLKPPSRSSLWNMASKLRAGSVGAEPGIVVGTCGVRLPMATADGIVLPSLTLAVSGANGAVLVAALGRADWQPVVTGLAASATAGGPLRAGRELLTRTRAENLADGIQPIPAVKARSAISRILGTGVGDVRLVYQQSKAIAPERLLTTKTDRPLTPEDVRRVVAASVARHNSARGAHDARWIG